MMNEFPESVLPLPDGGARAAVRRRRAPRGPFSEVGQFAGPSLALSLALCVSGACSSCQPAGEPAVEPTGLSEEAGGEPAAALEVGPHAAVTLGPEEDFEPAALRQTFLLTNGTDQLQPWGVQVSEPWLSVDGPEAGWIPAGASYTVPVDVHPAAIDPVAGDPVVADVVISGSGPEAVVAASSIALTSSFGNGETGGWTSFAPSSDTRAVYVSSSGGDDANDGLSPLTPKRTLAAAEALLRHGFPDWMLLRRGDVWYASLGQWRKSGRSPAEPMLVSTYGDALERPQLRTGGTGGIWTNGGGGSPETIDNFALVGLHFLADGYLGEGDCVGALLLQPGSHWLIEDCKFEGYSSNLVFQGFGGRHTDFRLRRSVIVDAYAIHAVGGHSQGLYAHSVDGLLIEENLFDHNGWNESVAGAGADIYSHNLYIDNGNTGVVVRGNIIANASSHGLQLRPGGTAVNNLFVRNSIALSVGGGNDPEPEGVTADVRGNVILDGKNIDAANPRGWGIWLGNIAAGRVAHNVIANNSNGTQPNILTLDGKYVGEFGPTVGVHDLELVGNIAFDWGGSVLFKGAYPQLSDIDFVENDLQSTAWATPLVECPLPSSASSVASADNEYYCQLLPPSEWVQIESDLQPIDYWLSLVGDVTSALGPAGYDDPKRSVATYNAMLGGEESCEAYLAEVRKQSSKHWRYEYTAVRTNRYIRGGF